MKDRAASAPRPSVDVGCELAAMNAKIDKLTALVEQLVVSPPSPERDWLSIDQAAELVGRTPQAVRLRCRVNKIGHKLNGEWRVDRARLLSQN
jgi:hypothetical protein